MASFRERALAVASSRSTGRHYVEEGPISTYFGQNVFTVEKMRKYLPSDALQAVLDARKSGEKIPRTVSDKIASGMKAWAVERGATHYTHLFQPLTGATAEKHEAFITPNADGTAMEQFRGSALVQQEPDASSFPNGGLRNTFEARGYTAWDPASPVFVLDGTLCIPSVFVSYTGDALDMKVPNLRSIQAIDKAATRVARLFDPSVASVHINAGLEQEYFLVDDALFNARPDLQLCGRTVIGHTSAKDQQLEDHYFGAIPTRVENFMKDFETEAYKLGIPLQTRHNEVAPNQFECAPLFSEITSAVDQNMLLMIVMQKVAEKHNLKVIFHEKPFQGVNGSGKHCNWSLCTDTGKNLLSPGKTHNGKLRFLAFYSSVLKAVADHNYLLMASVCSLGNTWRLGGNEAPPAILSVFSGSTLTRVFDAIVGMKEVDWESAKTSISLVGTIPEIIPDNTDRNRTSPFAFTGNKFEFRMLGSSNSIADANIMLNAAVADTLAGYADRLEAADDFSEEVGALLRSSLTEHRRILFDGNGYDECWIREAERRGLSNLRTTPDCLPKMLERRNIDMLVRQKVFSESEIRSRYEIYMQNYVNIVNIEAETMIEMAHRQILPAISRFGAELSDRASGKLKNGFAADYELVTGSRLSKITTELFRKTEDLEKTALEARKGTVTEKANFIRDNVLPAMESLRTASDQAETLIGEDYWPIPNYAQLLFSV